VRPVLRAHDENAVKINEIHFMIFSDFYF